MLTDIFAYRYLEQPMWENFDENARRLLVQSFRIVSEQIYPYYQADGKTTKDLMPETWEMLNKQLAMELGLKDLSSPVYGYWSEWNGNKHWVSGSWSKVMVCENFVCSAFDGAVSADQFVKERLSFVEIAFRRRESQIELILANLSENIRKVELDSKRRPTSGMRLSGNRLDAMKANAEAQVKSFAMSCHELNERLRQARTKLHYHNGYIQVSVDEAVTQEIEEPFWKMVNSPIWKNVDHDMKEAIDLRDTGGRDPSWYAAKALESTIKIISDEKGWTTGTEKGAANYIDNLRAKKNGEFIKGWEQDSLTRFFSSVRNPFGHGAGSSEMPMLSPNQTDWAIEFCMIWIKNLIRRM